VNKSRHCEEAVAADEAISHERLLRSLRSLAMTAMAGLVSGFVNVWAASTASSEATITSDELEIRAGGEQTFFRGHVVLNDAPYLLKADRMQRTRDTGTVSVMGHLDGTWLSDKGETIKAYGDEGLYKTTPPVTELWGGRPKLIRWETAQDKAPVQVVADHFIAVHEDKEFFAVGHVEMTQNPKILARSDRAKYDQKTATIHLYGPARVFVHIVDAKGIGDFTAEKGWVTLKPKTAQLAGRVRGHIDPGQAL